MIKGSELRDAEYPIDALFIDRWSPRAMSGEPISEAELLSLCEAARWAPSSGNAQPWRLLYALRDSAHWPLFLGLLGESNRLWAQRAGALLLLASRSIYEHTGKPSVTHSFDTGAAWGSLALQGFAKGYVVHGMEGFDYARARHELHIPEAFRVEAMVAVGRPAPKDTLPAALQEREGPKGRRAVSEWVCAGPWALAG